MIVVLYCPAYHHYKVYNINRPEYFVIGEDQMAALQEFYVRYGSKP